MYKASLVLKNRRDQPSEVEVIYTLLRRELRGIEDDDPEFRDWIESISATQEELKTLISNPEYSLYQAKQHVRLARPTYGLLMALRRFQGRCAQGWKQLMSTLTAIGHHRHLPGH